MITINQIKIIIIKASYKSLLGYIASNIRVIYLIWEKDTIENVIIYGVIDGEYDYDDEEILSCAATELLAQIFPINADSKLIRCDYPEEITEDILGVDLDKYQIYEVYRRYEE